MRPFPPPTKTAPFQCSLRRGAAGSSVCWPAAKTVAKSTSVAHKKTAARDLDFLCMRRVEKVTGEPHAWRVAYMRHVGVCHTDDYTSRFRSLLFILRKPSSMPLI